MYEDCISLLLIYSILLQCLEIVSDHMQVESLLGVDLYKLTCFYDLFQVGKGLVYVKYYCSGLEHGPAPSVSQILPQNEAILISMPFAHRMMLICVC